MNCGSVARHLHLQRVVPQVIAHPVLQQTVAITHGPFICQHSLTMIGQEAQRHAIQKPPSSLGPLQPESIHRRDQPQHTRQSGQRNLRSSFAVDPGGPWLPRFGTQFDSVP